MLAKILCFISGGIGGAMATSIETTRIYTMERASILDRKLREVKG